MEIGGLVKFVVTLTSGRNGAVYLHCIGKVLRIEKKIGQVTHAESIAVAISIDEFELIRSEGRRPKSVA